MQNNAAKAKSTIQLKKSTISRLKKHGFLGESYENVVNNMLEHMEKCDRYWSDRF